jgi:acyl-CoA thioesterase FadM
MDTTLPRSAFSARDAARAGDVWRLLQEVAVEASTAGGWPPMRYRQERNAFVVRRMIVRHHEEATYGERLEASSWISRVRRDMFSTREIRIRSARGAITTATQEWVHVSESLEPVRAPRSLLDAFAAEQSPEEDAPPLMPAFAHHIAAHAPHVFSFRAWWTWMDPLDHVNHPAYVDFCDEALATAAHAAGMSPLAIASVAEDLTFRSGVVAGEDVRVESVVSGLTNAGAALVAHRIFAGDRLCVTGTTVRRLIDAPDAMSLVRALDGGA